MNLVVAGACGYFVRVFELRLVCLIVQPAVVLCSLSLCFAGPGCAKPRVMRNLSAETNTCSSILVAGAWRIYTYILPLAARGK